MVQAKYQVTWHRPDAGRAQWRRRSLLHRRRGLDPAAGRGLPQADRPRRRDCEPGRDRDQGPDLAGGSGGDAEIAREIVIPGWCVSTRPQVRNCAPGNLEIPGSMLSHRPGMTTSTHRLNPLSFNSDLNSPPFPGIPPHSIRNKENENDRSLGPGVSGDCSGCGHRSSHFTVRSLPTGARRI